MKKYISEMIFTFIFVLVVLGVTDDKKGTPVMCGLAIGLTLVLVHIVCIPITGTSVNPARSIGPALFEGGKALTQLWLFIVAPFAGAAFLSAFPSCGLSCGRVSAAKNNDSNSFVLVGNRTVSVWIIL